MTEKKQKAARVRRLFRSDELTDVITLYGDLRAVIRGCRKILSYAPEKICIAQRRRAVCLSGKDLRCSSFSAACATVEGEIRSISFETLETKEKRE